MRTNEPLRNPATLTESNQPVRTCQVQTGTEILLCRALAVDSDGAVRALSWALLALSGPSTLVLSLILIAWHPRALLIGLPFLYASAFAIWVLRSPRRELLERNLCDLAALVMACAGRWLLLVRVPICCRREAEYTRTTAIESPPWLPPLETRPQVQPNAPSCPCATAPRSATCPRANPGGPSWPHFPMNPTTNPTTRPCC